MLFSRAAHGVIGGTARPAAIASDHSVIKSRAIPWHRLDAEALLSGNRGPVAVIVDMSGVSSTTAAKIAKRSPADSSID